jgi:outer membrane lipoprotein-sorting protein
MKKLISPLIALLLVVLLIPAHAQTLQDVLDKHFKAIGQEKLLSKKTYSVKATIEQMGMVLPMEMKMKRPNKFRMEMEMQGKTMIQAYDGENGWLIAPWVSSEPQDLTGAQLDQAMDQANIDGELYNYAEKGFSAELLGKEFIDDTEVFNIKLISKEGTEKNYYIDTDNYFVRKVKARVDAQGQEVEVEQNMNDYREFEGVMMATNIESKSPMGAANIIFERIIFGEQIDDSIFIKP